MTADEWIASDGYQRYRKDGESGEEQDRATRKLWEEYPELRDGEFRQLVGAAIHFEGITPIEKACEHVLEEMENDYLHYQET